MRRSTSTNHIQGCPLWLAAVGALLSALITLYGVIQSSYRLARIPDELKGRVNSVFRLILFSSVPIGLALTALLLQIEDVRITVGLYTAGLAPLALIATANRRLP